MVVGAVFTDGIILVLPCVLELGSIGHQSVGVPPTNWGRRKAKDRASKADVSAGDRVRYKGRRLHLGQTCQLFQLESRKSAILQSENKKKNFSLDTQSCIKRPFCSKVKNILKGSLDLIPSPSPSVKIQIMCGKVCLRCKGKTLLGFVNKLLKTKSLLTSPSNVLPLHIKQTFLLIIWTFTEGEGVRIESRLPFTILSTLHHNLI